MFCIAIRSLSNATIKQQGRSVKAAPLSTTSTLASFLSFLVSKAPNSAASTFPRFQRRNRAQFTSHRIANVPTRWLSYRRSTLALLVGSSPSGGSMAATNHVYSRPNDAFLHRWYASTLSPLPDTISADEAIHEDQGRIANSIFSGAVIAYGINAGANALLQSKLHPHQHSQRRD